MLLIQHLAFSARWSRRREAQEQQPYKLKIVFQTKGELMLDRWKAHIGWITPRVNSDTEIYDFYQIAPKDVVLVVNSLAVVTLPARRRSKIRFALIERGVKHLNLSGVDHIMQKGAPVHLILETKDTTKFSNGCRRSPKYQYPRVRRPWPMRSTFSAPSGYS